MKNNLTDKQLAMKVSLWSMIVNIFLSIIKVAVGFFGKSSALISDGIHSLSDVFSTVAVMIGINASSKESDTEHRYGHERIECVVGMYLSSFLAVIGFGIGYDGTIKIINHSTIAVPSSIALYIAVLSVVVKEMMFRVTMRAGEKTGSTALKADAWHHRSDALSSIGSFVGILGARLGFTILDPIACILICLMIFQAAYEIGKDCVDKVVDKSCDEDTVKDMVEVIKNIDGVYSIKDIKTRLFGSKKYVDIIIYVDGKLSVYDGHAIAMNVHEAIEKEFEGVKHCMVHVDPIFIN